MKFNVEGMTCSHCERAIARAVAALGGTARVDIADGTVEVDGLADETRVRTAIEDEGYRVLGNDEAAENDSGCCRDCHT
jgi:copper chaperone